MFLLFIGIDKLSLRLFKGELVSCVIHLLSCAHKLVSCANKFKEGHFSVNESELPSLENEELVSCLKEFKEDLVSVNKVRGRVPCAYNEEEDLVSCANNFVSCLNNFLSCANNFVSCANRFLSCVN